MDKPLIAALLLFLPGVALGQTHTMYGNNVVPSGAQLTLQSGSTTDFASGSSVDFTGATVTGLPAGGAVTWGTITGTLSSQTDLNTELTGKQPLDSDLTAWAAKTAYAGTLTITTGKTFNVTNNLTLSGTDGSTLAIGAGGTLGSAAYTASTAYQPADLDLDIWAAVTPATGMIAWINSPGSGNLRATVTDENGTGALLFNGATAPNFTTGITIDSAAASGKILQGDGTDYAASTPTWPTTAGTAGYGIRSDGTNFESYPKVLTNSSVANQSISTSDVYLLNSNVTVAAGDFKAKGQYRCVFDMAKTAGTGTVVITVRAGTFGTIADTSLITFTAPGSGTSVADTATFEVIVTWRTVGSGTSAVVHGICRAQKNAVTNVGFWNTTTAALTIVGTPSSGFNSTTFTNIGLSFQGFTVFAGTNTLVQAQLIQ